MESKLTYEENVAFHKYLIKSNRKNNILFPLIAIAAIILIAAIINFILPDMEAPELVGQAFVIGMAFLSVKVVYGIYRYFKLKTDLILVNMKEKERKYNESKRLKS